MIRKVTIKNFKRYENAEFLLEGPVVLAGPNNMGKTTALQAIAAWNLALNRWRELNDYNKRNGYTQAPMARQAFLPVPLRNFDWLFHQRQRKTIEIEVQSTEGWTVTMELKPDSTEQIYVRPTPSADPEVLRTKANVNATYVPPMTGLSIEEPVYTRAKQDQLLGQGKPGEIIRNLLVEAHGINDAWEALRKSIRDLFRCELLPPNSIGADIVCEYQPVGTDLRLDVSAAGSGMQQVLMLLAFLHMRPASVLLLDEPDAHLHVFLQDVIYAELRSVATRRNSQLIIATHSEVIINSVEPEELMLVFSTPRRLADKVERTRLVKSLRTLTQADVMLALGTKGILYLEGSTDWKLLREFARILQHPLHAWLSTEPFWKPATTTQQAREHYEALQLIEPAMTAVQLVDGDGKEQGVPPSERPETGKFNRIVFKRYEVESYLLHPGALKRYIDQNDGKSETIRETLVSMFDKYAGAGSGANIVDAFIANPADPPIIVERLLADKDYKARSVVLPPILSAAGIHGLHYTRYHEIAEFMLPEEIHPEVREKLDFIKEAFGP